MRDMRRQKGTGVASYGGIILTEVSPFIRKYRTKRTLLTYRYRDMRARVNGKVAGDKKTRIWDGLPIGDRQDFIDWALNDPDFNRLFEEWEDSGFEGRGPTIHRIDREDGYVIGNMKWMSHTEKSRQHLAAGRQKRLSRRAAAKGS